MPAERTTMRQVREVLRLKFVGDLSNHEIARRVGVAPSTVRATLKRLRAAGLSWPLPDDMTDAALEARLFAAGTKQGHRRQAEPDWAARKSSWATSSEEMSRQASMAPSLFRSTPHFMPAVLNQR